MPREQFLREQIDKAKRLAAAMTNSRDRERFDRIASDYQRENDDMPSPQADQPS